MRGRGLRVGELPVDTSLGSAFLIYDSRFFPDGPGVNEIDASTPAVHQISPGKRAIRLN